MVVRWWSTKRVRKNLVVAIVLMAAADFPAGDLGAGDAEVTSGMSHI